MILSKLIEQYHSFKDDAKVDLIYDFNILEDNAKWDFLLKLIDEEQTYDLVKVEIYKIIQMEKFDKEAIIKVKDAVLQSLSKETDILVKQWGFISLEFNYCDFPEVIDLCVKAIEDPAEDEDIRFNALNVLENSKNTDKIKTIKDKLLVVDTPKNLKESVKAFLEAKR